MWPLMSKKCPGYQHFLLDSSHLVLTRKSVVAAIVQAMICCVDLSVSIPYSQNYSSLGARLVLRLFDGLKKAADPGIVLKSHSRRRPLAQLLLVDPFGGCDRSSAVPQRYLW